MTQNKQTEFEKDVREGKLVSEKIMQTHIDNFNQGGGAKPVKVMPTEPIDREYVSGFFTQEKVLLGRTPMQMEHDLGLNPGDLKNGATIYKLSQTPTVEQFVPAGYTHMPGGRFYEPGQKYPVGPGYIQFHLKEPVPAEVIGKVGYEEHWKGPSTEQSVASSPLSSNSAKVSSTEEISESVGEIAANATAGPVGEEIGKVAGEAAGKAQQEAVESTGQSTEDPVKSNEPVAKENSSDEGQSYGYGY